MCIRCRHSHAVLSGHVPVRGDSARVARADAPRTTHTRTPPAGGGRSTPQGRRRRPAAVRGGHPHRGRAHAAAAHHGTQALICALTIFSKLSEASVLSRKGSCSGPVFYPGYLFNSNINFMYRQRKVLLDPP